LYIRETLFANKVFSSFDDGVVLEVGTYIFFSSRDDLYFIDSRMNPFEDGGDDMHQVKFEFCLKMLVDQFCEIKHISQNVHCIRKSAICSPN
jgi:hypothetical protein